MDNTTKSRLDQLQLKDSSRLVVVAVCRSEDLSEKDVAFICPFCCLCKYELSLHYPFAFIFCEGGEVQECTPTHEQVFLYKERLKTHPLLFLKGQGPRNLDAFSQ